jgi:phasin family protein
MSTSLPTEKIVAAQKAAFDSLLSVAHSSLNSIEKFNSLNLSTTRNLFAAQLESIGSLFSAKTPQDILALQKSALQPQIEKIATYARQFHDIATEAHDDFVNVLEGQHAELNDTVSSLLDGYAKSSDNSSAAVAAVKSAISAANSAFANANKAARQVAGITGAGVSATVQAIGAANQNQVASRKKIAA